MVRRESGQCVLSFREGVAYIFATRGRGSARGRARIRVARRIPLDLDRILGLYLWCLDFADCAVSECAPPRGSDKFTFPDPGDSNCQKASCASRVTSVFGLRVQCVHETARRRKPRTFGDIDLTPLYTALPTLVCGVRRESIASFTPTLGSIWVLTFFLSGSDVTRNTYT